MMKTLLIVTPLLATLAMVLWLRYTRRASGRRWIFHWLATLVPAGLMLAIAPFAHIPDLLFVLAVAGTAAFAGGGLYLLISALAASETVQAAGASAVESFREAVNAPGSDDDSGYRDDDDTRFISESHRREVEIYGEHAYYSYGRYDDD